MKHNGNHSQTLVLQQSLETHAQHWGAGAGPVTQPPHTRDTVVPVGYLFAEEDCEVQGLVGHEELPGGLSSRLGTHLRRRVLHLTDQQTHRAPADEKSHTALHLAAGPFRTAPRSLSQIHPGTQQRHGVDLKREGPEDLVPSPFSATSPAGQHGAGQRPRGSRSPSVRTLGQPLWVKLMWECVLCFM